MGVLHAATGIDYWVNIHRRQAPWADKANGPHAVAFAKHLGRSFADWVGSPSAWGQALRKTYNALKHEPNHDVDEQLTADLAVSAQLALGAAILDRAARSRAPSRSIFNHHRYLRLGHRLRTTLR